MAKIAFEKLRIVIVGDNVHMRCIVRSLLRAFGSREIYEAENGASGLKTLESYSPDILITDIKMPIFDGIELIEMIRNPDGSKFSFLPIIVLSAYSEKKFVVQARDAGVSEFLCKPVSASILYERIQNVIENPRRYVKTRNYFGPDRRRFDDPNYVGSDRRETSDETFVVDTIS